MEPLVSALVNAGGMGILAGALLYLHRDSIKSFREELAEERKYNSDAQRQFIELKLRLHGEVLSRLEKLAECVEGK